MTDREIYKLRWEDFNPRDGIENYMKRNATADGTPWYSLLWRSGVIFSFSFIPTAARAIKTEFMRDLEKALKTQDAEP